MHIYCSHRSLSGAGQAIILGLLLLPMSALAHVESGSGNELVTGLLHPISGLDHILAMVAVGLWGAQLGQPAIWLLPVTFPLIMAGGGLLGLLGVALPGVEVGIACSALLLGGLILTNTKPPAWLATLIVAFFAVFHGHAHGNELPAGSDGLLYSLGFVVSTGLLHAAGILIGLVHRWNWGQAAIRSAGAGVALGGLFFLTQAVA